MSRPGRPGERLTTDGGRSRKGNVPGDGRGVSHRVTCSCRVCPPARPVFFPSSADTPSSAVGVRGSPQRARRVGPPCINSAPRHARTPRAGRPRTGTVLSCTQTSRHVRLPRPGHDSRRPSPQLLSFPSSRDKTYVRKRKCAAPWPPSVRLPAERDMRHVHDARTGRLVAHAWSTDSLLHNCR
jgi:hypothetical protein